MNKLEMAARWIAEANGLLITAGAGMGVDSVHILPQSDH
jgi:hypothetical protein